MDPNKYIGLDFETYSAVDLFKHGLERYVTDETFQPLMACTYEHGNVNRTRYFPLFDNDPNQLEQLMNRLDGYMIVAHNAGFERRVLKALGHDLPATRFIDSAALARAAGVAGKLEAAAPQLLNMDKLESGKELIRLFSIPGKHQENMHTPFFNKQIINENIPQWRLFQRYCEVDAELGYKIAWDVLRTLLITEQELLFNAITMEMNDIGWPVDVAAVDEMQRRYFDNLEDTVARFRDETGASELNLNSLKQLKEWCLDRGVRASSFDEKNVAKLIDRITRRITTGTCTEQQLRDYAQVLEMLYTKRELGGSSLKKLQVIIDTVGPDNRLRDQYLHIGAGQTWRTTGRSVQMQNLKRLSTPADMDSLHDSNFVWTNNKLAANLRQVFTSSHPDGKLIVGDFSSIESRGLAWLAGEEWKIDSYFNGDDMYKVLAAKIYGLPGASSVDKVQRQTGKVGELSCGYGAGPGAVLAFAEGMGVEMSEAEATTLVRDWRDANPNIVQFWWNLDDLLRSVVVEGRALSTRILPHGFVVEIVEITTPQSLNDQHPRARSICVGILDQHGRYFLRRVFHGTHMRGKDICYYKPSERKTGDLWTNHFTDPKTKQIGFYKIYGGKLAGILTQSFCREIFFRSLTDVFRMTEKHYGLDLIGQFHDEIVLDWTPKGGLSLTEATAFLERYMTKHHVPHFPMAAEIKYDYRYTK